MTKNQNKALVTGAAGFIGYHLCKRLLTEGYNVTGIDNLNDYYDVNLKQARLGKIRDHKNFKFHKIDIADRDKMPELFKANSFDVVVNLAA